MAHLHPSVHSQRKPPAYDGGTLARGLQEWLDAIGGAENPSCRRVDVGGVMVLGGGIGTLNLLRSRSDG